MCIFCPRLNRLKRGVGNMCSNTKKKIAMALRQLMNERPFEKITVQHLMDVTQMKRQSFYYHFQDTRDVLMWICRREVFDPLMESELELEEWFILALELLDRDRCFYRKLLNVAYHDFLQEFDIVIEPRMLALLYPGRTLSQLSDRERFALDFATDAACLRIIRFVDSRDTLTPTTIRDRVEYLIQAFSTASLRSPPPGCLRSPAFLIRYHSFV